MIKQVITIGTIGVLMSGCSVFNKTTDTIDTAKKPTPIAIKVNAIGKPSKTNTINRHSINIATSGFVMLVSPVAQLLPLTVARSL